MSDEEPPGERAEIPAAPAMTLARGCWSLTAAVFLLTGIVLLVEGYVGYAIVSLVIGVAAALNLL